MLIAGLHVQSTVQCQLLMFTRRMAVPTVAQPCPPWPRPGGRPIPTALWGLVALDVGQPAIQCGPELSREYAGRASDSAEPVNLYIAGRGFKGVAPAQASSSPPLALASTSDRCRSSTDQLVGTGTTSGHQRVSGPQSAAGARPLSSCPSLSSRASCMYYVTAKPKSDWHRAVAMHISMMPTSMPVQALPVRGDTNRCTTQFFLPTSNLNGHGPRREGRLQSPPARTQPTAGCTAATAEPST